MSKNLPFPRVCALAAALLIIGIHAAPATETAPSLTTLDRKVPDWLTKAVFYQIYPQSFYDSNGDGIGDLPGITSKLDYIKSLGVTAVWLNPIYDSPFGDAGYDVRDYLKIAPRYGTNEDAKKLFQEAHRRGIRVVLDLVAGHTSREHAWFKDSSASASGKHADWYIWSDDPKWVKSPGARAGFYYKNYFDFQPALNYGFAHPDPLKPWEKPSDSRECTEVREEMRAIMRYWLDLGCDGFRVDMASSLIKGDNKDDELRALWQNYRSWLNEHYPQAVLISEWSEPSQAIPDGFDVDFLIHFHNPAYRYLLQPMLQSNAPNTSFFSTNGAGNIKAFTDQFVPQYERTKNLGFISLPTGNHDFSRPRFMGREIPDLKVVYSMLLTMPGVPFIYYGDEIGMRNLKGWPDKEGAVWRGSCRSPMQWSPDPKAGFSTADTNSFYLPLDPDPRRPNVATEETDPDSLLNFVRTLINLRSKELSLGNLGGFSVLYAEANKYPFVYLRSGGPDDFVVALNPGNQAVSWSDPRMVDARTEISRNATLKGQKISLGPASFGIYRLLKTP